MKKVAIAVAFALSISLPSNAVTYTPVMCKTRDVSEFYRTLVNNVTVMYSERPQVYDDDLVQCPLVVDNPVPSTVGMFVTSASIFVLDLNPTEDFQCRVWRVALNGSSLSGSLVTSTGTGLQILNLLPGGSVVSGGVGDMFFVSCLVPGMTPDNKVSSVRWYKAITGV